MEVENEEMWKVTKIIFMMLLCYDRCILLYCACLPCSIVTRGVTTNISRSDATSQLPSENFSEITLDTENVASQRKFIRER